MEYRPTPEKWQKARHFFETRFGMPPGAPLWEMLYLIGIREYGKSLGPFTKDDKINLIHVGTCAVLEPFGYCERQKDLPDGWPSYKILRKLPRENDENFEPFMQYAIVRYLESDDLI